MRITIKQHHLQFLNTVANQMGTTPAVAADYLFWELRRTGFYFSFSIPIDTSAPIPPIPEGVAEVVEEHYDAIEFDTDLQRIIALGLEDF